MSKTLHPARRSHSDATFTLKIRVTAQVMATLNELRETGFFGDGKSNEAVAEELLRKAVREARDWLCNT